MLTRTFWRWLVCAAAVALWLWPNASLAQQSMGTLTGTIVDAASKQPVADVVVTATSPSLQGEQMVVTDSSGLYRIPSLPPGTYSLRLEKEAFKPYTRDGIGLRADTTLRISLSSMAPMQPTRKVSICVSLPG